MQETHEMQVQSLGREDPLEKGMGTHSLVFLPRDSHGQRSLWSLWGHKELDTTEHTHIQGTISESDSVDSFVSWQLVAYFFVLSALKNFFIESQTSSVGQ